MTSIKTSHVTSNLSNSRLIYKNATENASLVVLYTAEKIIVTEITVFLVEKDNVWRLLPS